MARGIVRVVDNLGRIVLPKEYRKKMHIDTGTKIMVCEDDNKITIELVTPKCKICGSSEKIKEDFPLCDKCIAQVKRYSL